MPHAPTNRIAIIGAGPIGLETALRATAMGWDVVVFEKGRVADNVRDWGHVRLFSPFSMNSSTAGRTAVSAIDGSDPLPSDDELLTGNDLWLRYLKPLSELAPVESCIREGTQVKSIGRRWLHKGESIGQPVRQADLFELLVTGSDGETAELANVVIDCSGSYGNHRLIGLAGQGCPGENQVADECYRIADWTGADKSRFAGKHTLVVGSGYSAATAIVALGQIIESEPTTRVTWLTKRPATEPIHRVANDTLPERDRIAARANALVSHDNITWISQQRVVRINNAGELTVELETTSGDKSEHTFDSIVAHPGYRPDTSMYRELQVHECYASEGPIKLAAALLGESSGDCLVQPETGPDTLKNPEPGFFIIGSKSYGRNSRFLIQAGLKQIDDILPMIADQLKVAE